LLQPCGRSELCASRRSAHFGGRRPVPVGVFFRLETWPRLTSDVPRPLPRRHVNTAGFNASSGHLRSPKATASPLTAFAGTGLARRSRPQPQPLARPNEHDDLQRLLQSTRSSSTLANDGYPAPRRFSRRGVAPRGAPAARCRAGRLQDRVSSVQGTGAGLDPKQTSLSPDPARSHWSMSKEFQNRSRPTSDPPRERTNPRKRARMPSAVRDPVRFYSTRSGRTRQTFVRLARTSYRPGTCAVCWTKQHLFHRRQAAGALVSNELLRPPAAPAQLLRNNRSRADVPRTSIFIIVRQTPRSRQNEGKSRIFLSTAWSEESPYRLPSRTP